MRASPSRRLLPVLLALVISACTSTLPTKVAVDRKQNLVVPQVVANTLSVSLNFADRSLYGVQGLIGSDAVHHQNERANAILQRLRPHANAISPGASAWHWEIHVVDQGLVNAYTVGAGKIFVYRGLIEHLALNEDELAAIIAHEMAHSLRQHVREYWSNRIPLDLAKIALVNVMASSTSDLLVTYGAELPLSRIKEEEADRIGLELLVRAGYPSVAAQAVLRKLYIHEIMTRDALAYTQIIPRWTFLRSHPLPEDRHADLKAQSKKVIELAANSPKEAPSDRALSKKTSVNLDYIDDYEKWYLMSRIGLNSGEVLSTADWGYGWMLRRTEQGGLNARGGLSYLINDPQLKGFAGGVHGEIAWVFNPQWQTYGRILWARDVSNDQSQLQKYSAGVRWGDFNQAHLYIETSLARARPDSAWPWREKAQLEMGYARRFSLY